MKILFVSNLFPPNHIGGYEIACQDTYELLKQEHECFILTSNFSASGVSKTQVTKEYSNELELHFSFGVNETLPESLVEKKNKRTLVKALESFQPDLIYAWNLNGLSLNILDVLKSSKIPTVFHFMDESLIQNYNFSLKKLINYWFKRSFFRPRSLKNDIENSIYISKFTKSRFSFLRPKNSIVRYPFLNSKFIPAKTDYHLKKEIKCVFLGQIEKHKGIEQLCEILYQTSDENIKFHLDIYGRSLSGLDQELKKKYDFINIIEGETRKKILFSLHHYDIGFFPSVWDEPFGIAQIEMMTAGLPVFSSGRGGSVEVIKNRVNGILFDPENIKKSAQEIKQFINDYHNIAPQIGSNARKDMENNHSQKKYLKNLNEFFYRVTTN